jgi:glycosyltransferase involved in cell wall biosynthesis
MKPSIRVLTLLEAESITGSAKAVLEFARQISGSESPQIELSIAKFNRGAFAESRLTRAIRETGVPLHVISEQHRFDIAVLSQLRELVSTWRPDLIWSNSVKSHFLVRIAGLHRRARWVAFHHGYTSTDTKMRIYNQLDRWSLRAAHRVLTVCRPFMSDLSAMGVPESRIRIQLFGLRQQVGAGPSARVLLNVGRLSREKGHVDLIHCFAKIRELVPDIPLRLVLVGEGPERQHIVSLCRELKLSEHVTLVGHQDDVNHYYAMADLFLLTSHSEGSPNVLLEAMAAGIPVVATEVGGIPELAANHKEVLLVPPGDYRGIAAAAAKILKDPALQSRLVRAAGAIVARNAPEAYFRSIVSVFAEALT